jgi:hypothetical protein
MDVEGMKPERGDRKEKEKEMDITLPFRRHESNWVLPLHKMLPMKARHECAVHHVRVSITIPQRRKYQSFGNIPLPASLFGG